MTRDPVFEFVETMARQQSEGNPLTVYHILFGYAKLMSIDEQTRKKMFTSEQEQQTLKNISYLFYCQTLDLRLMKRDIPIILEKHAHDMQAEAQWEEILTQSAAEDSTMPADGILKQILQADIPEILQFQHSRILKNYPVYFDSVRESKTEQQTRQSTPQEHMRFSSLIEKTKQLYTDLLKQVKGQEEAVHLFAQGYFQAEILQEPERVRPSATFLFAGPSGVGKTFLAQNAAKLLELPFLRLDMSEYSDPATTLTFAGAERSYKNAKQGKVTGFVKKNPKCVILFDEIEKAHQDIIYLFLQMLDAGSLTDGYTEESVSFRDTVLIFTTNIGKELYNNEFGQNLSVLPKSVILDALGTELNPCTHTPAFPAAILSRFAAGNVIMFHHLPVYQLIEIVNNQFENYSQIVQKEHGYQVQIDPMVAAAFLFDQGGNIDARTAAAQSVILLKNELYELGRYISRENDAFGALKQLHFRVELPEKDSEVRSMLVHTGKTSILVIGHRDDWKYIPQSDIYELLFADDYTQAAAQLKQHDIAFVLLDVTHRQMRTQETYLGMAAIHSEGMRCFESILQKLPQLPIYIAEKTPMPPEDRVTFLQRGAREFFALDGDPAHAKKDLIQLSEHMYLQERAQELVRHGRVLNYHTAQHLSDDGRTAEIIFYDFQLKTAATAADREKMVSDTERPTETFADVIGAEHAKSELAYFANYLKNPKQFIMDGTVPPKGVLLYGAPGTGKTMLARAMAGESQVTFLSATASEFLNPYVGEGEKRIRDLFACAKQYAPSVIFIDEIDAIGKKRTGSASTHHTETLLNALLTEMDGFEADVKRPVFVLAATNYELESSDANKIGLDPALLRRFDNRICVELPKEAERKLYLSNQLAKRHIKAVSADTRQSIAARTTGQSLAGMQNIIELAVRNARKADRPVDDAAMLDALEEYNCGARHEWDAAYYESVAIHEAGHAYISWKSGDAPSYVTIVSRGNFGGYMQHGNRENIPSYTKEQLLWHIRTALAGRAAELVFFGEEKGVNTGIAQDLKTATDTAMQMLCRYGMGGTSLISVDMQTVFNTAWGQQRLEQAEQLLQEEMAHTMELVEEGRVYIRRLADFLLKNNQATDTQIDAIFRKNA